MRDTSTTLLAISILAASSVPASPKFIRPTDANTGHTTESQLLQTSGPSATTSDNQVISGYIYTGSLNILHDNVTVADCLFVDTHLSANNDHAVSSVPTTGLLVTRCTFDSSSIEVRNGKIEYCDISSTDYKAVNLKGGASLSSCWVHDMTFNCGTGHSSSCVVVANGVTDVTIEGNLLDPGYSQNAAISLYSHDAGLAIRGVRVSHNWLDSGRLLFSANLGVTGASISKLELTDNLLGTDYMLNPSNIEPGVLYEQSGNTWYETGLPYTF